MSDFIQTYGMEIISIIVTGIIGFLGVVIKGLLKKWTDENTKEKVVNTVVKAVEQIYKDLDGPAKFDQAVNDITEMLNEKGITATELEIKMLIEAACNDLKSDLYKNRGEA